MYRKSNGWMQVCKTCLAGSIPARYSSGLSANHGAMSEWFKELVLKTSDKKLSQRSNRCCAATWHSSRIGIDTTLSRLNLWVQIPSMSPYVRLAQ